MTEAVSVWIAAIAALFSALFTLVYVLLTRKTVRIMEAQLEASSRPYICLDAYALPGSPLLKLRLRNLGRTAAEQLRLGIDRDFYQVGKQEETANLKHAYAFSEPIPSFAPGAELIFNLGTFQQLESSRALMPMEFVVAASYKYMDRTFHEATHVDLNMFRSSAINADPILEELRKIRGVLERQ